MLEKVKQLGLEKFAGDESAANDFVKGFIKEAIASRGPNTAPTVYQAPVSGGGMKIDKNSLQGSVLGGLGSELGKGLGGLLISGGVAGIGAAARVINNNNLHTKFLEALERAIASSRVLKEANKNRVYQYAETIFKFAPNVATDSNLLKSILDNAVHGESVDPMTIKTLTELESRYSDNNSFTPKAYL